MNENMNAVQEAVVCGPCQLVPLSLLALDHPEPVGGWEASGVELIQDDLGRLAIRRSDARRLIEERREWELKSAEEALQRQEEMDRQARPTSSGIPFPKDADPSMSAFEVMRGVDAEAEEADPDRRVSPVEEILTERVGRPRRVEVEEEARER